MKYLSWDLKHMNYTPNLKAGMTRFNQMIHEGAQIPEGGLFEWRMTEMEK